MRRLAGDRSSAPACAPRRGPPAACLVMGLVAAVASVTYTLGFRVMVDGALAGDTARIALGAALVAGLFTLGWLLAIVSATEGSLLTDRASLALGVRIARLVGTLPTLEHFERSGAARARRAGDGQPAHARRRPAPAHRPGRPGAAGRGDDRPAGHDLPAGAGRAAVRAGAGPVGPLGRRACSRRADDAWPRTGGCSASCSRWPRARATARELRTYGMSGRARRAPRRAGRAGAAAHGAGGRGERGWSRRWAGSCSPSGWSRRSSCSSCARRTASHDPGEVVMAVTLLRRAQTQISRSTDTAGSFATSLATARAAAVAGGLRGRAAGSCASCMPPERLAPRDPAARASTFAYRAPSRCSARSTSSCRRARRSRWSARTAPARRPWSSCCPGCTGPPPGGSWSMASTWPSSTPPPGRRARSAPRSRTTCASSCGWARASASATCRGSTTSRRSAPRCARAARR